VFTAVEAVTVKEVRFLRELEFIRALPRLAATGRLDVPTVDAPLVLSFTRGAVLLGARPHEEVLAGAIGCFWRLAGNEPVVFGSPEEFLTSALREPQAKQTAAPAMASRWPVVRAGGTLVQRFGRIEPPIRRPLTGLPQK